MTAQLGAFNSDSFVSDTVVKLVRDLKIECIVETGTFTGVTTAFLAETFPDLDVFTVEVKFDTFLIAERRLKQYKNVKQFCGSSEKILRDLLPTLTGKRILFYLDAHWEDYWPLLDELTEIAKNNADICCIVIDDFLVPNRPFKYDSYKNQPLDLQYVLGKLREIYRNPFYFFNSTTNRRPGGVGKLYCIPDEWKDLLTVPIFNDAGHRYVK